MLVNKWKLFSDISFDLFIIVKGIVHLISSVLLSLSGISDSQHYSLHVNLCQRKDDGVKCLLLSCKIVYSCLQRTLDFAAEYKRTLDFAAEYKWVSISVNTHISVLNMNTHTLHKCNFKLHFQSLYSHAIQGIEHMLNHVTLLSTFVKRKEKKDLFFSWEYQVFNAIWFKKWKLNLV